jgi:hypothetical protein
MADVLLSGMRVIDAGDIDADGDIEIIAMGGSSAMPRIVVAATEPAIVEWNANVTAALRGPFIGGIAGRSAAIEDAALLFLAQALPSASDVRLVRFSPEDGSLTVSGQLRSSYPIEQSLAVAHLDMDGGDDVFVNLGGEIRAYDLATESIVWSRFLPVGNAVTAADFNGDGRDELVASGEVAGAPASIEVFDVWSDQTFWQQALVSGGGNLVVADLDRDGESEIVVTANPGIRVYEKGQNGVLALAISYALDATSGEIGRDLEVRDIDGDGALEVVVLTSLGGGASSEFRIRVLSATLAPISLAELGFRPADMEIEPSPEVRKNLLFGEILDHSANGISDATVVVSVDPWTAAEIWRSPPLAGAMRGDSIQSLEQDGIPRIVAGTALGMFVTR